MNNNIRIGIIGAGIAGCSAALFARDLFPAAEIVILESSDRIGGRIKSVDVDGRAIEVGASFIHSSNHLMRTLLDRLDLTTQQRDHSQNGASVGVASGRDSMIRLDRNRAWAAVRTIAPYGRSTMTVIRLTRRVLKRWAMLYDKAGTERAFASCSELLASCGLLEMARMPLWSLLAARGVSARLSAELLSSIPRAVFMQDLEINGLAGLVSFVAAGIGGGKTYSIVGGNARLCERLCEAASARVLFSTDVQCVRVDGPGQIVALGPDNTLHVFSAIVSAIPRQLLPEAGPTRWRPAGSKDQRGSICTTLVTGRLAPGYFGLANERSAPSIVLSGSGSTLPFTTLQLNGRGTSSGARVYKLQSNRPIDDRDIRQVFSVIENVQTTLWTDCPNLSTSTSDRQFRLTPGIYDAGAFEPVLSTMESQLLGSRNAVRLLSNDWQRR